jgi:hypothetical protein
VRPESITATVLSLIPLSVMIGVGFVAAVLWLASPTGGPLADPGSVPVSHAAAGTAAVVAQPSPNR